MTIETIPGAFVVTVPPTDTSATLTSLLDQPRVTLAAISGLIVTGIVTVAQGDLTGVITADGSVEVYAGIPYAQPPVGKLRWRAPEPLKPSDKSFDAKKFGFSAMQTIDKHEAASTNPQSEDCLTLNIWTRGEGKNKPVMVFIHGGGFQTGGTSATVVVFKD